MMTFEGSVYRRKSFQHLFRLSICCLMYLYFSSTLLTRLSTHKGSTLPANFNNIGLEPRQEARPSTTTFITPSSTAVLNIFQVSTPVLGSRSIAGDIIQTSNASTIDTEASHAKCQVTLMEFSFVNSFGKPFVGTYINP